MREINYHSPAGQVSFHLHVADGRMGFLRAYILLLFIYNPTMIPPKTELVKCKYICALSAPSSFRAVTAICNFSEFSGEGFLLIYNYQGQSPQEIRYQLGEKIRMNIIIHSLGQTQLKGQCKIWG